MAAVRGHCDDPIAWREAVARASSTIPATSYPRTQGGLGAAG
jgi:hypothetical protein